MGNNNNNTISRVSRDVRKSCVYTCILYGTQVFGIGSLIYELFSSS